MADKLPVPAPKGEFLFYPGEDGQMRLSVLFEDETIWLTQKLMAELFQKDVRTLTRDELDADWVAKEREIYVAQSAKMPEDKRAQIAEGKLSKRLKDVVLIDQPFIKNEKESVRSHVEAVAKQASKS